ncbi:MAG: recombinase family protein, partial [Balneola sp.]
MPKKKKKNSLKAAIYIRVSTVEQSDNDFSSLDGQLNQCKTWIEQKNTMGGIDGVLIKNFEIYKDTKSGKDLKRPGIERLIKDAESGKIDLLIATKLD